MNLLCWNARGAASKKFRTNMMDLIHGHHLDILFVCEPRIGGQKALSMVQSLGFTSFEIIDPIGFSGGLWLLWNENKVSVEILGTTDQAITACVSWPGQPPWMFTAVYAKPCGVKRDKLWDYLRFVDGCHDMPWMLAGDFNEMLHVDDKLGGAPHNRIKGFKKWFDEQDMVDLNFWA